MSVILKGGSNTNLANVDANGSLQVAVNSTSPLPAGTNLIGSVKVNDGSGNVQPAGDVPARSIQVEVTDGTNVLGTSAHPVKVDPTGTTTQPVQLVAGTALAGQVSASNETSTIYSGTTALTPTFATIVASASGATTIVALVSSKKIRVLSMLLTANGAVNVKWQSHVTPTDLTGLAYLAANGGYVLPYNPTGWFQTIAGEALDINLSGAVAVGGHLTYIAV